MKNEQKQVPVLAMYDVRGIQEYIFRTNRLKEIMGASAIVENILQTTLENAFQETKLPKEQIIRWESPEQEFMFQKNKKIQIEVLFIGGGNAYVIYRNGMLCEEVNRKMSRMILEQTYSLQLAIAVVQAHINKDSFQEDYSDLRKEMENVKAKMPVARTLGALPIAKVDQVTGFPLVEHKDTIPLKEDMSRETYLKLDKYYAEKRKEDNECADGKKVVREFDQFITQHGEESVLAIVHIDGNDMGNRITGLLQKYGRSYSEAICTMRKVSYTINHTFKDKVFEKLKKEFEHWVKTQNAEYFDTDGTYLRKIIVAGDDVTFVCNARVALPLVKYFVDYVSQYVMFEGKDERKSRKKYGFSVCAGIAYMNSHFPFHIGYQVAEACCENAKKVAKKLDNMEYGRIGNWVDFQICRNAQMRDLGQAREKNYRPSSDLWLLQRPYHIAVGNNNPSDNGKFNEFSRLVEQIKGLKDYPRSKAMQLRNTYPLGKQATDSLVTFLKSRDTANKLKNILGEKGEAFIDKKAVCFDALEILDFYEEVVLKEGE